MTEEHVADIPSSSHPTQPLEDVQRYENQLDHLTQTINGLLDGLDGVARDINIAKDTQEKLYSAHHKVGFSSFITASFLLGNSQHHRNDFLRLLAVLLRLQKYATKSLPILGIS